MSDKITHYESEPDESEDEELDLEKLYYQRYPESKSKKKNKTPPYAAFIQSQREHQTNSQLLDSSKTNIADLFSKIEKTVLRTYYLSRVQQQQDKQTDKENKKKQTKQDGRAPPPDNELNMAFTALDKLRKQAATQEEEHILLEIRAASTEFEFNLNKQRAQKYALKHGQDFAEQIEQSRFELVAKAEQSRFELVAKAEQSRLELEQKNQKRAAEIAGTLLAQMNKINAPQKQAAKETITSKACLTLAEADRLFEQDKACAIQIAK